MKKKVAAVIPARMAASRFPGKPLARILGLPMIEHVRRRHILEGFVVQMMTIEGVKLLFSSGGSLANAKWSGYFN